MRAVNLGKQAEAEVTGFDGLGSGVVVHNK